MGKHSLVRSFPCHHQFHQLTKKKWKYLASHKSNEETQPTQTPYLPSAHGKSEVWTQNGKWAFHYCFARIYITEQTIRNHKSKKKKKKKRWIIKVLHIGKLKSSFKCFCQYGKVLLKLVLVISTPYFLSRNNKLGQGWVKSWLRKVLIELCLHSSHPHFHNHASLIPTFNYWDIF